MKLAHNPAGRGSAIIPADESALRSGKVQGIRAKANKQNEIGAGAWQGRCANEMEVTPRSIRASYRDMTPAAHPETSRSGEAGLVTRLPLPRQGVPTPKMPGIPEQATEPAGWL